MTDTTVTIERLAQAAAELQAKHLDVLAAAFLQEVGCPPSQCELVQVATPTGFRWYYRRREDAPARAVQP